jgi:hypothetical protein
MPRFDQPIEPMTLGNMRELGVPVGFCLSCWLTSLARNEGIREALRAKLGIT